MSTSSMPKAACLVSDLGHSVFGTPASSFSEVKCQVVRAVRMHGTDPITCLRLHSSSLIRNWTWNRNILRQHAGDLGCWSNHQAIYGQLSADTSTRLGDPVEIWELWQHKHLSIKEISRSRKLTETEVYSHIFWCVQQGQEIDWFDLCQEAHLTAAIATTIRNAKTLAGLAKHQSGFEGSDWDYVKVHCHPHVTDVHIQLYITMLHCGLAPEMLFHALEQGRHQPEEDISAIQNLDVSVTDDSEVFEEVTSNLLLQWLLDKDGASLLEIVLNFKDWNASELMRCMVVLEDQSLILLKQGIFRVNQRS